MIICMCSPPSVFLGGRKTDGPGFSRTHYRTHFHFSPVLHSTIGIMMVNFGDDYFITNAHLLEITNKPAPSLTFIYTKQKIEHVVYGPQLDE